MNAENVTHFDSFGAEHIPKEIRKFIGNKNIITNIYRIQAYDSVLRIQIYIPLMSIKRMTKNIKIFSVESKSVKMYRDVCNKYRKLKKTKISYI